MFGKITVVWIAIFVFVTSIKLMRIKLATNHCEVYDREKESRFFGQIGHKLPEIYKVATLGKELAKYDVRQIGLCMEDM
ncbi:MAG: hypothetical protein IKO23_12075 [Bacteroidales bacterium]|nr:hypothetical protein [Bacteroidales bacterium]